jgi:hypothetical protein
MVHVDMPHKRLLYWQRHLLDGQQRNSAVCVPMVAQPCRPMVWRSRQRAVSYGIEAAPR